MAMNKKEQETFDRALLELAEAKALSWPSYGEQARMTFPSDNGFSEPIPGWHAHFNITIYKRVELGCFTSNSHSPSDSKKTTSQGSGRFFASKTEAWRQVRVEATRGFAQALAQIDAEIAKAEAEPDLLPSGSAA